MRPNELTTALGVCSLLTIVGCAHTPPKELVDARAAYRQAAAGPAAQQDPARLHTAQQALEAAEVAFREDGDSTHTRDVAYVAQRKAQLADVEGRTAQNELRLAELTRNAELAQAQELKRLRGEYQTTQQQLVSEQQARAEAERRAQQASADLARVATVKQESRGMVITLSGQVLFASGKADLLPTAQTKLKDVANALKQNNPNATIVVEGHTDSTGSEALNLDLSQRRAQAVSDYLASQGVDSSRIRAEGLGFSRPLADNKTPAGRANNRRVEIVVQPSSGRGPGEGASAQPMRQPG